MGAWGRLLTGCGSGLMLTSDQGGKTAIAATRPDMRVCWRVVDSLVVSVQWRICLWTAAEQGSDARIELRDGLQSGVPRLVFAHC